MVFNGLCLLHEALKMAFYTVPFSEQLQNAYHTLLTTLSILED